MTFAADEPIAEPQPELPPMLREAHERRLHARARDRWTALRGARAFPSLEDLDRAGLGEFAPNSVVLTAVDGPPRLRFVGERLRKECQLARLPELEDVPTGSLLSRVTQRWPELIACRTTVGFEAEFVSARGCLTLYRGVLMPLSSNGSTIDAAHGVIGWKEIADPQLAAELQREMGLLLLGKRTETGPARDPF